MATVKKTIGRLPVYKGDWVAGSYSMLNQVTYLGSTFQSKIDNNTATPATVVNNALQVNANWNVVSNGTAAYLADSRLTSVESRATQLEQKSVSFADNSFIQSQKPKGLMFKQKDISVYAKSLSKLNLGSEDFTVVFIGRTEGSDAAGYSVFGNVNGLYMNSSMKIYEMVTPNTTNGIAYILMEKPLSGADIDDSIYIGKMDKTTNLHHIVITRRENIVTAYINGRRVHSKTQSRVLDFSNFVYDVYCSSHFYGGSVYNYAMTEAEALALWNGGRYDEAQLSYRFKTETLDTTLNDNSLWNMTSGCSYNEATKEIRIVSSTGESQSVSNVFKNSSAKKGQLYSIQFEYKGSGSISFASGNLFIGSNTSVTASNEYKKYIGTVYANNDNDDAFMFKRISTCDVYIRNFKLTNAKCLLEYKPENIRVDRMINTGTAGSAYDLIYSLPIKPTIIYEAPYKDKIVLEDKTTPDFHPIAVGQRCYTSDGKILEAKLPVKGSEWQVSDWKLQ